MGTIIATYVQCLVPAKTYITICYDYYYKVGLPHSKIPEGYHGNQPLLNCLNIFFSHYNHFLGGLIDRMSTEYIEQSMLK